VSRTRLETGPIPSGTHVALTEAMEATTQGTTEVRLGLTKLRPELYARALRLSRSPSQAEDIVQDTMIRALRFENQFRAGTNLRAWGGQVLMRGFLTGCRKNKRERRALERLTHDPCAWVRRDPPAAMSELSARPARALASLTEGYRSAIKLVDIQGLSYRDAAEKLSVPVGTIMSRLHRGRKLLAAQLCETELCETEIAIAA